MIDRFGNRAVKSIVRMAGIRERRVVSDGVCASDLGCCAATRLLECRQIDPRSIDLLVFVSQTGDYQLPATACVLHERLGLSEACGAFDINMGCTAFPYGLSVVHGMIASGQAERALLVVSDAITTIIHPKDRGLVPLHGDGGTAALIEPCDAESGIQGILLGTDGTGWKHLVVPASGARNPPSEKTKAEVTDPGGSTRTAEHLQMNGPAVFHFSLYKVPEVIRRCLDRSKLTVGDLDLVLLHQANKMMVDRIYQTLEVPEEKRFYNLERVGNCSGASTPILLADAWRQGKIKPGSLTLIASFGVGLSWGVVILRWPDPLPKAVAAPVEYVEDK